MRELMRGDTWSPITGQISDDDGPVPFAGGSGVLLARTADAPETLLEFPVTPVAPAALRGDPDAGRWIYEQQPEDVALVGDFDAEMEVTWSDGTKTTFPNRPDQRDKLIVYQDLNPPA